VDDFAHICVALRLW